MLICVFVHSRFIENPLVGSWETNPCFFRGIMSQLVSEQDQSKTHMKVSKNHNVVGEECLAHIRIIVVSLCGKLTYLFLCNYEIASTKVCCYFWSVNLILLLMTLFCCLWLW
jgi:hypothetical protein